MCGFASQKLRLIDMEVAGSSVPPFRGGACNPCRWCLGICSINTVQAGSSERRGKLIRHVSEDARCNNCIIGEGGSKQYKIDNTYLWFADRTENKEYLSPDLYVCQTYESLSLRMKRVVQQKHSGYLSVGCAREVITQLAMEPNDGVWPDHRMIATDAKTDGENWAIIELDKAAD